MDRVIKFRGLRTDGKGWVYGYYMYDVHEWKSYIIDEFSNVRVIPETVGQFTGLKDKSGKEIYEGDIVHFDETAYCVSGLKIYGKIVYYKGSWAIEYQAPFTKDFHLMRKLFSSEDFIGSKSEIIGNIHDESEV